jgi:photosystem II reaction center protein PsbP
MKPMNAVTKRLAIALGAVLVVSAGFILASQNANKAPAEVKTKLIEFRDEEAGFSVSLPAKWQYLTETSQDPLVRLLAGPPATDDTVSVKVIPLPAKVTIDSQTPQDDINALQGTFDQIVDQLPGLVEVLHRQRLILNGTPGWYYIYKFKDGDRQGIHVLYFLFEGDKEYVVTFQAFPEEHYPDLAPVFDDIIGTFNFKLNKASPAASPSPSPAAAASPTP